MNGRILGFLELPMTLKIHLAGIGACLLALTASAETSTFKDVCTGLTTKQCAELIAPVIWNNTGIEAVPVCEASCDDRYYLRFQSCREGRSEIGEAETSAIKACMRDVQPKYNQCRKDCAPA
jgi:hypothetical protein